MSGWRALSGGLARARRAARLALVLWAASLGLALLAALPGWLGLRRALANSPEGDRLLSGFSFTLLADLLRGNQVAGELWLALLAGLGALALLVNALCAGGVLELLARPGGPLLESFGRGAGRFVRRFLRLAILAALGFGVSAGFALMLTAPLRRRLEDSAWEPMPLALASGNAFVLGLLAVVWLLALDLARARVAAQDLRRVRPALAASLRQVLSGFAALGLWSTYGLACLGVFAGYVAFRNVVPAGSWSGIALMAVIQQAVMLARAGLRLVLWGSLFELQAGPAFDSATARSSNG